MIKLKSYLLLKKTKRVELEKVDSIEISLIPKTVTKLKKEVLMIKKITKKMLHVQTTILNQKQNLKNKIDQKIELVKTEEDENIVINLIKKI